MRLRLLTVLPTVLLSTFLLAAPDTDPAADTIVDTVVDEMDGLGRADGPRPAPGAVISEPIRTPIEFSMLAFTAPTGARISYRTSTDGSAWTAWTQAEAAEGVGPDRGTGEARRAAPDHRRSGEPMWVGQASYLQARVTGAALNEVDVDLIDSMGLSRSLWERARDALRSAWRGGGTVATSAPGQPPIVTRAGWGADESLRSGTPAYAGRARYAVLHHTAGTNDYTATESPGVVRGIYAYHTRSRGWSDIGYNFLVDRFGTIYEGRRGGLDRAVIGAHALGFNTGGIGVSMMGNHDTAAVSKATRGAVIRLLAWKLALHGIDPGGKVSITSTCTGACKHPKGTAIRLPTLFGHRDIGYTSCPGANGYAALPGLRTAIGARQDTPAPFTPPFSDDDGSVHAAGIGDLFRRGVTVGCTSSRFCPKASVNRGQMASFLARTMTHMKLPTQRSARDWFADDSGSVHEPAINMLTQSGVSAGCGDNRFCPRQPIRRGHVAEWVARAFDLQAHGVDHFTDDDGTPYEWAINALADAGLTEGCAPDRYCHSEATSRGQMASFLSRTINTVTADR
jgi:N-acetylmuramoyl-L-alanine amidase/S-layer homology domain